MATMSPAWGELFAQATKMKRTHLKTLMQDQGRNDSMYVKSACGMVLDYCREKVDQDTMGKLFALAEKAGVDEKKRKMFSGAKINETEGRPVLHVALRAPREAVIEVDGANVVPEVWKVLDAIKGFSEKVRSGEWKGFTGKPLTDVVCIGIGGSYLGVEFVFEALKTEPEAAAAAAGRRLRFLANVDPIDVKRALDGLDAETTLVLVVSKTFTTAETMLNAKTVKEWLIKELGSPACVAKHVAACSTALDKTAAFGIDASNVFGFWDWVGGRFSCWSAVGAVALSLQYGFPIVDKFLKGGHEMDNHFFSAPAAENLPLIMGLLSVWNCSVLGYEGLAVLPYCQALVRFVPHIQQLDMESNGKRVTMGGAEVPVGTGAIYFGEPGTNGQHSFYQLMHQGRVVPAEFIGFSTSQNPVSLPGEPVSNHEELMSNFFAQPDALAIGKTAEELKAEGVPDSLIAHKTFPGDRPSLSLLLPQCNATCLGKLLALYEHRTAVQGWVWDINSFDQWGVQLGKVLATEVRNYLKDARGGSGDDSKFIGSTKVLLKKYLGGSASSNSCTALTEAILSEAPYSQRHLFDGKSDAEKESIVRQLVELDAKLPAGGIRGYLERARKLLADAKAGANPYLGLTPKVPQGQKLTGPTGPGSEAYAELERLGMDQLSKTAFCLVAGGLGERLGYPGIKISITAELATGASFLKLYVDFILAFQAHARKATGQQDLELPLVIMTSGDTNAKTEELLERHKRFGMSASQLTVLCQEKVPALVDVEARMACKGGEVDTKPHGHGDVHALLLQSGLVGKWVSEKREWLVLFQDTNPLPFRSICAVLGVSKKNDFTMNSVAVPRIPEEAVGAICELVDEARGSSTTINVEYNQLDPLLKTTPAGGDKPDDSGLSPYPGNINILVFGLAGMSACLETTGGIVPEFVNPKWADAERTRFKKATRLESMMQDFPKLCGPSHRIGFTQLDRIMCFTCVKNAIEDARTKRPTDCALSAEADIYACNAKLLALAGAKIEAPKAVEFLGIKAEIGPVISMSPSFGISLEQIKEKLKGEVTISQKSLLVIDGDVTIDGLILDGAAEIVGSGTVKGGTVKNSGKPLVAMTAEEMAEAADDMKIRGYKLGEGQIERIEP